MGEEGLDWTLESLKAGEPAAQAALYVELYGPLQRCALRFVCTPASAEDIVSGALLRFIHTYVHDMTNRADAKAGRSAVCCYLYTMVRRDSVQRAARERRCEPITGHAATAQSAEQADPVHFALRRCLARLSERERLVVQLITEGYSRADIGEKLNCTGQNVGQIYKKAMGRLRKCLGGGPPKDEGGGRMGSKPAVRPPSEAQVTAMLRALRDERMQQGDRESHALALYISGDRSPEVDRSAIALIGAEPELRGLSSDAVSFAAEFVESKKKRWWNGVQGFWPPLLAATCAALLLLYVRPQHPLQFPEQAPMSQRGAPDTLLVGLLRGDERYLMTGADEVRDGDRIGLFYSAQDSGFLRVVLLDAGGSTTKLWPLQTNDGAIQAGHRVSLPAGGTLRSGTSCEWFVGVFSDSALDAAQVDRQLQEAVSTASADCQLTVTIPAARSVSLVPIRW